MPPTKPLTAEQEKDRKLANSLRAPLSFNTQNTMQTTTPSVAQQRPASPNIFTDIGNVMKEVPGAIANVPKKFIAGGAAGLFKQETPETYGQAFKQFGQRIEEGPLGSKALSTPQGIQDAALNFTPMGMAKVTGQIIAKEAKPVFEGLKDLSTSIVEKLKGRTTVSKQFISDLTKGAEVKLSEKNIINNVLESSPDNISVADFAKKVQDELLPLTRNDIGTRYKNISLSTNIRGNVANYSEHTYESPIKTSAGGVHFSVEPRAGADMSSPNYFGHTRIEDMADNSTRRVIEVQSDLYQKGNLEREMMTDSFKNYDRATIEKMAKENPNSYAARDLERTDKMSKLQQYNDPTAHYRMIREEIKKAAEDGKTKLQFPTGETAMKVEGLGQMHNFVETGINGWATDIRLKPENVKVGMEVKDSAGNWIITDVLGDGKFKAIPKHSIQNRLDHGDTIEEAIRDAHPFVRQDAETFDISGKVDQNNPIYKFYDKEVRKFLNKFGGKEIVDDQGVSWIEIPITKEQATEPVQAFGKIGIKPLLAGAGATGLFTAINNTGSKVSYEKPKEESSWSLPARQAIVTKDDIEALRPLIYGEISNRPLDKKKLEANVIINTAINRQKEYAQKGKNYSLAEIIAMPNQYQAYGGEQYKNYSTTTNALDVNKKQEVDAIMNEIEQKIKQGDFQDNTQGAYYYIHNLDGTITYDNERPLFKKTGKITTK